MLGKSMRKPWIQKDFSCFLCCPQFPKGNAVWSQFDQKAHKFPLWNFITNIRETISGKPFHCPLSHIRESISGKRGKPYQGNHIDDKMHATNWLVTQTTETIALHSETKYESIEKRRQKVKYTSFLTTNTSLLIKLGMLQHYPIAYSSALRHDDLHKVFKLAP